MSQGFVNAVSIPLPVPIALGGTGLAAVPGANTQVIFNSVGSYSASAGLTFNSGSNSLSVTGTITASNFSGSSSGTNTGDQVNISGNAATVTTNANLTGVVTSVGNATSIASGAITSAMLAVSPYGMPYIISRGIY